MGGAAPCVDADETNVGVCVARMTGNRLETAYLGAVSSSRPKGAS